MTLYIIRIIVADAFYSRRNTRARRRWHRGRPRHIRTFLAREWSWSCSVDARSRGSDHGRRSRCPTWGSTWSSTWGSTGVGSGGAAGRRTASRRTNLWNRTGRQDKARNDLAPTFGGIVVRIAVAAGILPLGRRVIAFTSRLFACSVKSDKMNYYVLGRLITGSFLR